MDNETKETIATIKKRLQLKKRRKEGHWIGKHKAGVFKLKEIELLLSMVDER